jgi:hypothetical protein
MPQYETNYTAKDLMIKKTYTAKDLMIKGLAEQREVLVDRKG